MPEQVETTSKQRRLIWISNMPLKGVLHSATWLSVTRELRNLGWHVLLISPGHDGELNMSGVAVLGITKPKTYLLGQVIYQLHLFRMLLPHLRQVDVILFHELNILPLLALKLASLIRGRLRPCFVMDSRSLPMQPDERRSFKGHLKARFFYFSNWLANHFADGRTAITIHLANSLHIPESKLWGIWSSGVDLKMFDRGQERRSPVPSPGEPLRLIYIGSMEYERNLMGLIQAVLNVRMSGLPIVLYLVGNGEEFEDLKASAAKSNGAVHVFPPVDHADIPGWLHESHIGVLPFPDEEKFRVSSPIKLFEYMAAGLPVLATRIACHTDVVGDGDGNFVFWAEGSDVAALQEAICNAWTRREQLESMGQQAPEAAKAYSWLAVATRLHQALEKGIQQQGCGQA